MNLVILRIVGFIGQVVLLVVLSEVNRLVLLVFDQDWGHEVDVVRSVLVDVQVFEVVELP